ncbi:MAG: acyl-CoA dehydrogenase, partial [Bdellovibrionota bacterium]
RRYLMFNPIMKMKVTSQGEKVVGLLHEIIAAKGFEQDTYFETAIRDIGALPKLEGTTHVNMALVIKFTKNYFFGKGSLPEIPRRDDVADDTYLFRQKAGGLQDVQFGDYRKAFEGWSQIRNLSLFQTQIEALRKMLMQAPPTKEQAGNVDFMLASGELLTLVAYSQLVLESAKLERRSPQSGASSSNTAVDDAVLEQIFAFVVRDFAGYALAIRQLYDVTPDQGRILDEMISVRPVQDSTSLAGVWDRHVSSLRGVYPTGLGQS